MMETAEDQREQVAGAPVDGPYVAGDEAVLRVEGLSKHFGRRRLLGSNPPPVRAVDDVSFDLAPGQTLGLVGESGCGKTTLSRTIMRLTEPTSGRILVNGAEINQMSRMELKDYRKQAQIVFQDPYASLDPRQRVLNSIAEPLTSSGLSAERKKDVVRRLMERMGLPGEHAERFPHQFSGGQRQRIGIARALSVDPSFLVLDEPVSALDVSIQAQVLRLLQELRTELGLSYMLISHDLSVVRLVSDRVMVMYLGRIVEMADKEDLYGTPAHPYTASLLSAAPVPDPDVERTRERIVLAGDPPNPADPPSGCAFHRRCFQASMLAEGLGESEVLTLDDGRRVPTRCATEVPLLTGQHRPRHWAACHFPLEKSAAVGV